VNGPPQTTRTTPRFAAVGLCGDAQFWGERNISSSLEAILKYSFPDDPFRNFFFLKNVLWKSQLNVRAFTQNALNRDTTFVQVHDRFDNRQTETGADRLTCPRWMARTSCVRTIKSIEQFI
jgi:hypothetical protein